MRLAQRFRRLVYAQVLMGIVAFGIAEPNPGMLLVAGSLAVLSWYVTEGPGGRPLPRWVLNLAALAAVAWLMIDLFAGGGKVVLAMGHFTMWLQILLLFGRKSNREYAQLLVLSLMTMIAASILSVSMLYGLLLAAYCGLGLVTLLHFHLKATWDAVAHATLKAAPPGRTAAPPPPTAGRGYHWHFRLLTLAIGLICAAVAVAVFVATPRAAMGPLRGGAYSALAPRQSGFAPQVQLGAGDEIGETREPMLNMQVTLHGRPVTDPSVFLLRGAALDHYDTRSKTWSRSENATAFNNAVALPPAGLTLIPTPDEPTMYEATITLREPGMRLLFSVHPATSIDSDSFSTVMTNALDGQLSAVELTPGPLIYKTRWPLRAESVVTPMPEEPTPSRRWRRGGRRWNRDSDDERTGDPTRRSRAELREPAGWYARGWPVQEPRVARLAQRVLEPLGLSRDPQALYDPRDGEIAEALEKYLRNNFRYSLQDPPTLAGEDPVVEFLFTQRRGHCELFAAAHAALCRSIGMQARVITGYRASEYNRIGGHYVVRQSNAHAWTEVNLGPSLGWRTFDATPPDGVQAEHRVRRTWLTGIREVYELIEFGWISSVVAYDKRSREAVMAELRDSVGSTDDRSTWLGWVVNFVTRIRDVWRVDPANYTMIFVIVILLAVAIASLMRTLMIRRQRLIALQLTALPRARRRGLASRLRFYLTMLDMLERYGHVRPAWQSPFSFAQELAETNPMRFDPVVALTEIFYEIRFGHRMPDAERRQRIKAHLRQLEYTLSSREWSR